MVVVSGFEAELESENAMNKHSRSFFTLSDDIVYEVFSYLNQRDCLTSMGVCHEWCDRIPQYTRSIWKELQLDVGKLPEHHKCLERCLGSHVKHVIISQPNELYSYGVQPHPPYIAMQKLIDWKCTEIETFELDEGLTVDHAKFVAMLKHLAPQLSYLQLLHQRARVDLQHLLHLFPELTHLICHYLRGPFFHREDHTSVNIPIDYTSKLTYLVLCNSDLSLEEKELLLKRCPNLLCFVDSQMNGTLITPELESVSRWCPKINVYSTAYNFPKLQPRDYSAYINSKVPGLRYIHTGSTTNGGVDQVVRQLVKNKDTLEYLTFITHQPVGSNQPQFNDWPDIHGFVQLSKLHTLIHRTQNFTARSFVTILNCCPLLENFELYGPVSLDSRSIRSLGALYSLRYMKFYNGINLRQDLSLLTLLEHFPALENLIIGVASMPLILPLHFNPPKHLKQLELSDIGWNLLPGDEDHRAATLRFVKALTCSSKLELLRLTFKVLPGPSLSELVTIPTLSHLEIYFEPLPESQNLVDFIKALQNTVIETLKLHSLSRLSFAELDALAELQHLATVWLGGPGSQLASTRVFGDRGSLPRVSKKGVFQVLKKSPKLATFMLSNDFVMENEHQLEPDSTNLVLKQLASDILDTMSRHWNIPSPDPRHRHGSYEQRTFYTITRVDK